jgi:predicted methyltransferase
MIKEKYVDIVKISKDLKIPLMILVKQLQSLSDVGIVKIKDDKAKLTEYGLFLVKSLVDVVDGGRK